MASTKRMASISIAGVMCVVALATAAAGAHVFKSTTKGVLSGVNTNQQVFTTGAGTIECSKAVTSGTIASLETKDQVSSVAYSTCSAFGAEAEVSTAKYDFNAEGTVTIKAEVDIKVPSLSCELKFPAQGPLTKVTYTKGGAKLEVKLAAGGIKSNGGGLCPGGTTGTYNGIELNEVAGGTLKWE